MIVYDRSNAGCSPVQAEPQYATLSTSPRAWMSLFQGKAQSNG